MITEHIIKSSQGILFTGSYDAVIDWLSDHKEVELCSFRTDYTTSDTPSKKIVTYVVKETKRCKPYSEKPEYLIYSTGEVYSCKTRKFLSQRFDAHGYPVVTLSAKGESNRPITVHRLVAKTFIPNPDNKPEVNHINGIKTDNRVENLEWVTHLENMTHAYDTGLRDTKPRCPVGMYTLDGQKIKSYESITEASNDTKICQCNIGEACRGNVKQAGGYIWKYEE